VLMKGLYIVKWDSDDSNSTVFELVGSPYFAKLYRDLVDESMHKDAWKPDATKKWVRWRSIEARPEQLERTRARIQRMMPKWSSWSQDQKREMVDILLSPFVATQETIEELISL